MSYPAFGEDWVAPSGKIARLQPPLTRDSDGVGCVDHRRYGAWKSKWLSKGWRRAQPQDFDAIIAKGVEAQERVAADRQADKAFHGALQSVLDANSRERAGD